MNAASRTPEEARLNGFGRLPEEKAVPDDGSDMTEPVKKAGDG